MSNLISMRFLVGVMVVVLVGCASGAREGDRLFASGDLAAAESAYRAQIERSANGGPGGTAPLERAIYHLGLIYALPNGPNYQPEKANELLQRLLRQNPNSQYALHASLILNLQSQTLKLREIFTRETDRARVLGLELERLQAEAKRVEGEATDQEARSKKLASEIAQLRAEIEQLTIELTAREDELERIKQIDLATPP